jgi:septal ring factor EnvC (AmiA/AmiB activator)
MLVRRFGDRAGRAQIKGVAWRTQASAQVLAPVDAKVEYVGPLKGYGLIVILTPGEPYHVVLAGLDQAASGAGRRVAAGEPIGRMVAGGSELYLEVRRAGEPVDPAQWLASQPQRRGRS